MCLAVCDCQLRIAVAVGAVHRLKQEMPEIHVLETLGLRLLLRIDELEFVATGKDHGSIRLWADANPVQPLRRRLGAVGLDRNLKSFGMQCIDQRRIELKQWLASRTDDKSLAGCVPFWPAPGNGSCQFVWGAELSATFAIRSDKVGIAERANGLQSILFQSRPKITSGEPAEYSRSPGLNAFALERVEYLFDAVSHCSDRKCRVVGAPYENSAAATSLKKVDAIQLR